MARPLKTPTVAAKPVKVVADVDNYECFEDIQDEKAGQEPHLAQKVVDRKSPEIKSKDKQ